MSPVSPACPMLHRPTLLGEEVGQLGGLLGGHGRHGGAPVAPLAVGRHGDGWLLKCMSPMIRLGLNTKCKWNDLKNIFHFVLISRQI